MTMFTINNIIIFSFFFSCFCFFVTYIHLLRQTKGKNEHVVLLFYKKKFLEFMRGIVELINQLQKKTRHQKLTQSKKKQKNGLLGKKCICTYVIIIRKRHTRPSAGTSLQFWALFHRGKSWRKFIIFKGFHGFFLNMM